MNDKSANNMDLISAYHDGELTAAERADVEQLLASSPEARAELESYRTLTSMLREVGRPTLESDLTPVVMQMIEQRMLLPTTAAQPLSDTRKANAWTKWAVAIAAAAAALMIAVRVIPQNAGNDPVIAQQEVKPNTVTPVVVPQPETIKPVATNAIATVTPEKPAVAPAAQLVAADLPLEVIENLKRANPGKIVRFLKQSGKDVTVFHLMVLDIQPGLESLQMILSAQQISGPKDQQAQSGTVAVYVEANQDQLDKVIAELQSEEQKQFVALAVQSTPMKAEEVQKIVKGQATDVASQQVPLKKSELTTLGVNPVESEQIVASRTRIGQRPGPMQSLNGSNSLRKLLIVIEKAPASLLSNPVQPN
ncbi:MAG: hypothetical protein JWN70_1187 [Planctomycetaceae bacterium]|nr:hypothetical protein [Planctomycetaceae bacterium]